MFGFRGFVENEKREAPMSTSSCCVCTLLTIPSSNKDRGKFKQATSVACFSDTNLYEFFAAQRLRFSISAGACHRSAFFDIKQELRSDCFVSIPKATGDRV